MGRKAIDMTGMRFGRLTVMERDGTYRSRWQSVPLWRCRCDCGKETVVRGDSLRFGRTMSCGCLFRETHRRQFKENNPKRR